MNESEFPGGQGQPVSGGQQNEPTESGNPVMFSSEDASASASAQPIFDNSNSFDAPQDAISSDAESESAPNPGASSAHLFSGRFRRNAARKTEEPAFVPNPNAPDFFNDAMAAMTPAKEPSSGNGLKIAIIAVAAVLVIGGGILIAVLLGGGSKTQTGDNDFERLPEDAKAFLSDEDYETAMLFEEIIEDFSTRDKESIWSVTGKGYTEGFKGKYDKYKALADKISSYNTSKLNTAQKQAFESSKETLSRMLPVYEQFYSDYVTINSAVGDADATAIKKLLDSDNEHLKSLGEKISNALTTYREANSRYQSLGCSERSEDLDCEEIYGQMADAEEIAGSSSDFLDYVKSLNGGKSFNEDNFIYDDINALRETNKAE